jgi:hypothetical protein
MLTRLQYGLTEITSIEGIKEMYNLVWFEVLTVVSMKMGVF